MSCGVDSTQLTNNLDRCYSIKSDVLRNAADGPQIAEGAIRLNAEDANHAYLVRLPQVSGLDFQQRLVETGMQIPIIFITAHGDIPMSVRALKSGAVEFLTKPFLDQDRSTRFSKPFSGTAPRMNNRPKSTLCMSSIMH